ncbi:MAG: hypothetical protein K8T91_17780 [Planctomycetes bacterium]|nr:hypothetical protein [Planctomycetota bacterium]
MTEDIADSQANRTADHLACDTEATGDPWSAGETQIAELADPQQGLYLAGERHLAWFESGSGRFVPVPGVLWHLGKAASTIDAHGSGTVRVWLVDDTPEHVESAHEVTVYDWLGHSAAIGDEVIMIEHLQSRRWYLLAAAPSSGTSSNVCQLIQVRLSAAATPAAIDSSSPAAIAFDEVALRHGEALVLGTDDTLGQVTINATGTVEIHHFDAAAVDSTPGGDNLTEWWVERKAPSAADFVIIADTVSRLYHPNLHDGGATTLTRYLLAAAFGDTLRVCAKRLAGSDSLTPGTLADGGPTCHLALRMLCGADTYDHTADLTSTSGMPYDPTTGSGDSTLKLTAYYPLDEAGATDNRADFSGHALDLRVLESPGGAIDGVTGHISTAAQFDAASEWLCRGGFGDPNPEAAFRPVSQRISIACWLTIDSLSGVSGSARLVGLGNDGSWWLEIDPSGNLSAVTGQSGDPGQPNAIATVLTLPTAKPLFVVALFDGLAARAELRVRAADGTLDQSASHTVDPKPGWGAAPSDWHFDIGSTSPSTYASFKIEQLGIWTDVWLTPAQQDFMFAAGAGRRLL